MLSFMNYQRKLPSLIFLALITILTIVKAQNAHSCLNNGNYTYNSTYETNLITLLTTISTNIDDNGFYNASLGESPDRVNAYALCRGDVSLDTCRSCVRSATAEALRLCPNYRQAITWLEFCTLRYSNETLYGVADNSNSWMVWNVNNASSPNQFMSDLSTLIGSLRDQAATGGSLRKVAAGNRISSDFQVVFALVQCTPDLSQLDCDDCLLSAASLLPQCCNSLVGGRILAPSCNIRYEFRPFYNETRLQELAFIPSPILPPTPSQTVPVNVENNKRNSSTRTLVIIVVSFVTGLVVIVLSGCFVMKKKSKKATKELAPSLLEESASDDISTFESLQYDFGIFKAATNDFSEANKLGQGGFGAVYKGSLPNGQEIAVKRLSVGSHQGDLEFKNEVMLLVKLQHRNLVRLLGFSLQGSEKLLVYEFVQNASLDAFIFDTTKRSLLDWDKRYKIIGGIARGILYLHEDSRLTIIHRDLKAGNVLLDENMNPKIADFGMARLFVHNATQGSTNRIVGTYGYMAPEYAMHGEFSVKSDVFSFGVLLLEVISGQKNNYSRHGVTRADLISSAWKNWRQGTTANLVDPLLNIGSSVPRDILRCIHIGLLCVHENAVDRPTMASVIAMLNSFSVTLPIPSHPAFFVHNRYDSEALPLREFSWREENSNIPHNNDREESISRNEMSISEFQAR